MSIVNTTECIICYNLYDTDSRKPCIGTCGHSICENCKKHQMVSPKCPQCNREEAFATAVINQQTLELLKSSKSLRTEMDAISMRVIKKEILTNEGTCCECLLRSQKLRLCIDCSLKSGLLQHEKHKFVLNIKNKNAEEVFQEAKNKAICGDCALDGPLHEGHRTMPLATLAIDLEEKELDEQASRIIKNLDTLRTNAGKVLEKLGQNFNANILLAEDLARAFDKVKNDIEYTKYPSLDPVLVADRKQTSREPLLISPFNPTDNAWGPIGRMPNPKSDYAVVSNNAAIFVTGGMNNGQFLRSVEMYDKKTNLKRQINHMRRSRTRSSACFHNHKIYVAGGFNNAYTKSVEIFDPTDERWCDVPSLQKQRADASMVSCNGELFALGGFNGINYEETIEKLNNQTHHFEVFASMEGGRAGFGACEFRGRIYIAGGWNTSDNTLLSVRSFDPKSKTWRNEPSMNKMRKYFTLHATNKAIFAIRGCAGYWNVIEENEQFDPHQMKWGVING